LLAGIVGPNRQTSTLARQLAKFGGIKADTLGESLNSMRLDSARHADLVHFIYAPVGESVFSQRKLLALAVMKKPVIFHWIGSDVVNALEHPSGKIVARLCRCEILVKWHLAQTSWLAKELSKVGIQAAIIPLLPDLDFETPPLPARACVLAYLPDSRYEFYGGKIMERLATEFPNVRFIGTASSRRSRLPNLQYLLWQASLDKIWRDTSILLRITKHDGLPWMLLEALAKGRQVIFSYQFPFCYRAGSFDEARTKLSEILVNEKLNLEGARFVRQRFDLETQIKRLVAFYEAALA
jgi:hypothetical protein